MPLNLVLKVLGDSFKRLFCAFLEPGLLRTLERLPNPVDFLFRQKLLRKNRPREEKVRGKKWAKKLKGGLD